MFSLIMQSWKGYQGNRGLENTHIKMGPMVGTLSVKGRGEKLTKKKGGGSERGGAVAEKERVYGKEGDEER